MSAEQEPGSQGAPGEEPVPSATSQELDALAPVAPNEAAQALAGARRNVAEPVDPAMQPVVVRVPSWLAWAGLAAFFLPLGVLVHEQAHYWMARAFGFPDLIFHATSVSHHAEEAGYPEWQRGLQSAAGPLTTWLLVAVCCGLAGRRRHARTAIVAGLSALSRSLLIGVGFALVLLLRRDPAGANLDEVKAAHLLGLGTIPVMLVSVLLSVAAAVYLIRRLPAGRRWRLLALMAAGGTAGLLAYMLVLGRMLG